MARLKLDNYAVASAPRLGLRGWLRWAWRQITSMRVALLLLLFLGLAAIPGAILPQRTQDPGAVRRYLATHGEPGRWVDRLGLLDVFGSAWFTAIYVLLFASLVGCIVPRIAAHARALRLPPAAAPSSLARYEPRPAVRVSDGEAALERAAAALRPRIGWRARLARPLGYRVRMDERVRGDRRELALAADDGALREWGNLTFHTALVGLLVTIVAGSFLSYRGQVLVVEGHAFTNSLVAYDSFTPGRGFDPARLDPFVMRLDAFEAEFDDEARPLDFRAFVTVTEPRDQPQEYVIRVNHPLTLGGVKIYLQGNGYAPALTVRDAAGEIAFSGAVPFLPQDGAYTSTGVVKVPDVSVGEQIGLAGTLLPSASVENGEARSVHPDPRNPIIAFQVYVGDLGLDDGFPQNVYVLDESRLTRVVDDDGQVAVIVVRPGETVSLPGGLGTVTWDSLPRFVALDLRADPTLPWILAFALAALAGVTVSLFAPQRRVWVLATCEGEGEAEATVVTAAGYAPAHDGGLARDVDRAIAAAGEESP